jgi:exopolysaccharide production protein ExoZ
MVCAYHLRYLISDSWRETAFGNGWLGVQVFFIISGFIMVHTTGGIRSDFVAGAKKFFKNRVIRIVPLYYICTFLMIAHSLDDGYLFENGSRLVRSLLFISPMTSQQGPEYGMPSLDVGWSLNYEMLFYFLFTLAIFFRQFKYHFLYTFFFLALLVIPFWQTGSFPGGYRQFINYNFSYMNVLTNPVMLHFVLGISLGLVMPGIKASRKVSAVALLVSSLLFISYFTGITGMDFNMWNDLLFCGLLVFSFLLNDYCKNGIQLCSPLVRLGDMSYSVYLLHPMVLIYVKLAFQKTGFAEFIYTKTFFLFTMCVIVATSFVFYTVIEKKLTRFLKLKFNS